MTDEQAELIVGLIDNLIQAKIENECFDIKPGFYAEYQRYEREARTELKAAFKSLGF